jgi:molybdopterin-binding protein
VTHIRIKDAAVFLGVSDDTVRRWIENGVLDASMDEAGRKVVDGVALARLAQEHAANPVDPSARNSSARNRFVGLVTRITSDVVMSQVELQCGPHRVVSLMSTEAVRDLDLKPGSVAVAVIKSTNVIVEAPRQLS